MGESRARPAGLRMDSAGVSTSMEMRLNSSKQPQDPEEASPLKMLAIDL